MWERPSSGNFHRSAVFVDFRWHDLRHTFPTRLRQRGVAREEIANLRGHKTLAMSKRYAHISMDLLHQAVSRSPARVTGTSDTEQSQTKLVEFAVAR